MGYHQIWLGQFGLHLAHRLAWFYETGHPPHRQIDHENERKQDNRYGNLRYATPSQNVFNSSTKIMRAKVLPRGVTVRKSNGRFKAQISLHGKSVYLGTFSTPEEASEAYCAKAREYYGKFAERLNYE